ncbi:hypothetical protein GH714_009102 [Hevea brasiliensis]|uniref:Uncharacterized protein n=1 Tax=Hevea brasiliensis TaxID=3981 RepID=A0A6A6M0U8_HEVBR|nr:hypothetical protein GH714_009102 [Hevea brasiliensis]
MRLVSSIGISPDKELLDKSMLLTRQIKKLQGVQVRKRVWKFTLEIVGLEIKMFKATQVEQPLRYCGVEIVVREIKNQKDVKFTDDEKERGRLDRPHWFKCNSNREGSILRIRSQCSSLGKIHTPNQGILRKKDWKATAGHCHFVP